MRFEACPCADCDDEPFRCAPVEGDLLVGQRFGRLVVLGDGPKRPKNRNRHMLCLCDCGTVKSIPRSNITAPKGSNVRSCGCIRAEWLASKHRESEMIGRRFGALVVLARAENLHKGHARYLCRCDCGREKPIRGQSLRNGRTRSCGCALARADVGMIGRRFGMLTVAERAENSPEGQSRYLVRCDCGGESITTGQRLRNGHTRSCGCKRGWKLNAGQSVSRRTYLFPYAGRGE